MAFLCDCSPVKGHLVLTCMRVEPAAPTGSHSANWQPTPSNPLAVQGRSPPYKVPLHVFPGPGRSQC